MKKILRFIFSAIFLFLFWPVLLYKKFGNTGIKLKDNTVIVCNHYSNIDPFLIKMLFAKRKLTFIATADVKKRIFSRFITWLYDCVYVSDSSMNLQTLRQLTSILTNGGVVVIFPEGVVNPRRYGFLDFKAGVSLIAKIAKSNVLPIFIYPEPNVHKKSKIFIGDIIGYDEYAVFKDNTDIATYFLSKIMDLYALM